MQPASLKDALVLIDGTFERRYQTDALFEEINYLSEKILKSSIYQLPEQNWEWEHFWSWNLKPFRPNHPMTALKEDGKIIAVAIKLFGLVHVVCFTRRFNQQNLALSEKSSFLFSFQVHHYLNSQTLKSFKEDLESTRSPLYGICNAIT